MSEPEPELAQPAEPWPEFEDFEVLQEVGQSPRGTIYKARRRIERDVVALKVLRASACNRRFLGQLPANAEASFFLAHKGLVRALGCVTSGEPLLLISEFAGGRPLARTLGQGNALDTSQALQIVLECADALRFAAVRGRYHGRLHPADVLVGETRTRVTGVGLGECPEPSPATPAPYLFDPLIYTAPEAMPGRQLAETVEARIAVDVYSLGAILLHALTGKPPSAQMDLSHAAAQLPPAIREILAQMLSSDPATRIGYDALVTALTEALEAAGTGHPQAEALPASAPTKPVPVGRPATVGRPIHVQEVGRSSVPECASSGTDAVATATSAPTNRRAALLVLAALALLVSGGLFSLRLLRTPEEANDREEDETGGTAPEPPLDRPFSPDIGSPDAARTQGQTATAAPPTQPSEPEKDQGEEPLPSGDDDYAVATRQLAALRNLLRRGDLKYSPALLKAARTVAEKAGRNTPTGQRAQEFAAEIEQHLAKEDGER